jgi:hypothetical protein
MNILRLLTTVFGLFFATSLLAAPDNTQNVQPTGAPQTESPKKPPAASKPRASKPPAPVAVQAPAPPPSPLDVVFIEQKCLRALNGACTNPLSVESARLRAEIIPAVRVSYLGTPAGTVGGNYITFERLFQDNPLLFGLPTFITFLPCCIQRSK